MKEKLEKEVSNALCIMRDSFVSLDSVLFNEETYFVYKAYQIGRIQKDLEEAYAILARAIGEEGYGE